MNAEKEEMLCDTCNTHLGWAIITVADDYNLCVRFYCDAHAKEGE